MNNVQVPGLVCEELMAVSADGKRRLVSGYMEDSQIYQPDGECHVPVYAVKRGYNFIDLETNWGYADVSPSELKYAYNVLGPDALKRWAHIFYGANVEVYEYSGDNYGSSADLIMWASVDWQEAMGLKDYVPGYDDISELVAWLEGDVVQVVEQERGCPDMDCPCDYWKIVECSYPVFGYGAEAEVLAALDCLNTDGMVWAKPFREYVPDERLSA